MSEPARRRLIVEEIVSRLQAIQTANNYETDAGLTIFVGFVPVLGEDDPAVAIAVTFGRDDPKWQGEKVFLRLPIEIHVLVKTSAADGWILVEMALADVKRAIEQSDRTLGGLVPRQLERGSTQTLPRDPGALHFGVGIPYVAPYAEVWGKPDL